MPEDARRTAGRKWFEPVIVIIGAVYFLVEDVLWAGVIRLSDRIARHPLVAALERQISALPPYVALALLAGPAALILPIKLAAVYLIATGHAILGLCVIVAAKMLGTALAARIFHLTRPRLMTIDWFRRLTEWVGALKLRLYAALDALPMWRRLVAGVTRVKAAARRVWARVVVTRPIDL